MKRRGIARKLVLGLALFGAGVVACSVWLYAAADDSLEFQPNEYVVTEVTQLNRIQVADVFVPRTTAEIAKILAASSGPVSIGGARCSMGGQIAEPGSTHLDLRRFSDVLEFSPLERTITVEAGSTWRDIQDRIDPDNLSIKIMQTYSNFTVGGSLSVNAHGRYMGRGPIVQSVRALRLVMADGAIVDASPKENAELFYGVVGGYGGLAVIAEVTLDLVANGKVERNTKTMPTTEYAEFFRTHVRDEGGIVFHNADLAPPDFDTARVVSWSESEAELTDTARLIPRGQDYSWRAALVNGTASFPGGYALRKHVLEPIFYWDEPVTWRNHEASYDIAELEPPDRQDETYVLREYFVPEARFDEFVPKMRDVFSRNEVPVINVSVRHASTDPGTLLAWARGETFAFVVYYQQGTTPEAIDGVRRWSREMIDAVLSVGGTYYLPYQNHATRAQFLQAYPRAAEFFALKERVDPTLRLQNSLFYHYGPSPRARRDEKLASLGYQKKPEGQTLLTVPEWYLVWNPLEYVEHLERGHAPDTFPFWESVREYMSLYKKVIRASDGVYPHNDEYVTMLRVIGASTAVEYLTKGAYEASIGRLFRWTASAPNNAEQRLITEAQRSYSQLIFDKAWYEFRFLPWVARIWSETPILGADFLRRTERKLAFSAEFAVKAAYAQLVGWAAQSAYGPSEERVQIVAQRPEGAKPWPPGVRTVGALAPATELIELGRWNEFSKVVPHLASEGFDFVEIAGNDHIAVSLVEDVSRPFRSDQAQRLLQSRVVSNPAKKRTVWFVTVPRLGPFLRQAQAAGVRIEHVYDY